ncbi:MAG TPA: indole-3-glycerol phosphate synthase TrpC [Mobilitalea sp.]|nr:indole-3-glycerol phosphate synthase TrpC [Mobilitalea sp.]
MILDTIAESSRVRVAKAEEILPLEQLKSIIYDGAGVRSFHSRNAFAFERALQGKMAFICEVKKASPSKGIIAEDFPYLEIAKDYEKAGADAISVLTEPEYFKGDNSYLTEISNEVQIPVLRKDFTVDEYQIYEAKVIGADAVLLICSLLDTDTIHRYLKICDHLGLSALVEAHTQEEIYSAMKAGARIIGVNNRNLKTFEVDLNNSVRLRGLVPKNIIFVAESGIKTAQDITELRNAGVNAVLIGETLMRSPNKKEIITELRG